MAKENNLLSIERVNSANVRIDNSADANRVMDMAANVEIAYGIVNNFSGDVMKDGVYVAGFNCYNAAENSNHLSINYQNVVASEQGAILEAVQGFIMAVREYVGGASLKLTTEQND